MNDKQHYDLLCEAGVTKQTPCERIAMLVNRLLEAIYTPVMDERKFVVNQETLERLGLGNEPFNRGALHASCEETAEGFWVTIDEAEPQQCPMLCEYIRKHLAAWGWNVEVETEW